MTIDELEAQRNELGAQRLAELRKACAEQYGLHAWDKIQAPGTSDYCKRCF